MTPYGFTTETELPPLVLELKCYRWHDEYVRRGHLKTDRKEHFRNIVNMLWGPQNKRKHFQWNPWAERMLDIFHAHPITGQQFPHAAVSGCASSGKSLFAALYGLVNWLCDPADTMVLMTSTSLKDSGKRIWGHLQQLWIHAPAGIWPGKMVGSLHSVFTVDFKTGKKISDASGIFLIAGEKSKEKDNIGKIIGAKARRVIFVADELPELSEAIVEAAFGNLNVNPFFQFVGLGNFKSWYDPFGQFVKPKSGNLDDVTEDVDEYETEAGFALILDGMKSPNILTRNEWAGLYAPKDLENHQKRYGPQSALFWRMCRSRPTPVGLDNVIYSESEFIAAKVGDRVVWSTGFTMVSGMDPSFTNGGDRCVQWIGKFGLAVGGKWVLELGELKLLREDITKRNRPRNFQIADQFRENCEAAGVEPENAALDSTGAGSVLADIIAEVWSPKVLRVDFSGKPTAFRVSVNNPKAAEDLYDRRVTELWYAGLEYLKAQQLKGLLDVELLREMKARRYDSVKGAEGLKAKVETKTDMKKRLNFSPDKADAYFVLLDLCRQRHGFLAGGLTGGLVKANDAWDKEVQDADAVYATVDYAEQQIPYDMAV